MATLFVSGATGVLGRATVPQLLSSGHTVRALSRGEGNDAAIRALGAEPVRGDLFDPDSLRQAVAGADAIFHLATRIPPSSDLRRRSAWVENDRIRAEGTKNLVDAALATGAQVFVYPSFAFVYPDSGDAWIDAVSTPVAPTDILLSTIAAEREVARFAESGGRGISLRLGALYGSDLASTREQLKLARRGISVFGSPLEAFTPTIWIGDAASALVAALDRAPSGLFDIIDDEPVRQRQLKTALAQAAGRRRTLSLPAWIVRMMAGPAAELFTRSLRISNRRFSRRDRLGATSPQCDRGHGTGRRRKSSRSDCARSARRPLRSVGDGAIQPPCRDPATVRAALLLRQLSGLRYAMGCGRRTVQRAPAARPRRRESFARGGHPVRDSSTQGGIRPRRRGGDSRRPGSALHLPRRAPRGAADGARSRLADRCAGVDHGNSAPRPGGLERYPRRKPFRPLNRPNSHQAEPDNSHRGW